MARNFEDCWSSHQADLEQYIASRRHEGLQRGGRTIPVNVSDPPLDTTRAKAQAGWENFTAKGNAQQELAWLKRLLEGVMTPFEECWKDHQSTLRSHTKYCQCPTQIAYRGDLIDDTRAQAAQKWPEFPDAADLEKEEKWLTEMQRQVFLNRPEVTQQFDRFTERHYVPLNKIAARMFYQSHFSPEDLVQETFLSAYNNFHSLRDLYDLDKERLWLIKILERKFLDSLRQQKARDAKTNGRMETLNDSAGKEPGESSKTEEVNIKLCMEGLLQKLQDNAYDYTGTYTRSSGKVVTRRLREQDIEAYRLKLAGFNIEEIRESLPVKVVNATVHDRLHIAGSVVQREYPKECQ